jgi:release factor glutamine methyltransferase
MATPARPAGSAAARAGLRAVLAAHADRLAAAGVEEPRLEAERICAWVLATDRLRLHLDRERALAPAEAAAIAAAVARRAAGTPLAYLLGTQPFRGLMLRVGPAVLVPRPETEEVVGAALEVLETVGDALPPGAPRAALDLGTGSGCIALALAQERPGLIVTAVEASAEALEVARQNARDAGLETQVAFLHGDLYGPLAAGARFDLIVSNPPYLTPDEWDAAPPEVRAEPRAALVGGADGLAVHRAVLAGAGARLCRGGAVVLEIGATQGDAVAGIARAAGFAQVDVRRDLAGRDRIVVARRSP